jgi:serine/threonine protein kinase
LAIVSTTALLDALRRYHLLLPEQADDLSRSAPGAVDDPQALARLLVQRGWLTPYQANQLFLGRGADLLLGNYVLLEKLGEGGMGVVFKARHWKLGRTVAVKLIRKQRLDNRNVVRRFLREVRSVAALNHPNIVRAFDADEVNGTVLLVMEYVRGTDLARLVKKNGPLPAGQACEYIRQAALGLQHASERGIVHRDIKPHNLLLNGEPGASATGGTIKILDMGLARFRPGQGEEESGSALTGIGAVVGTPDYIAPEQSLESHEVDIRADLYSLGCTFYFLLTGQPPFSGGTGIAKLLRHQLEEPTPVTSLRSDVPAEVAGVVRRLLVKKPADRYQTPAELVAVLEGPASRERERPEGGARTPVAGNPSEATPATGEPPGATGESLGDFGWDDTAVESLWRLQQASAHRRLLRPILAGGGMLLVLLAGLGFLLWQATRPVPVPVVAAKAKLVLDSDVPNLRVRVAQGEDYRADLNDRETAAELEAGTYSLSLVNAPDGVSLDAEQVTLAPGGRVTVRVQGGPLGAWSLVARPPPLPGVRRWTVTSRSGRGSVRTLAYHPQGRWLAAANEDGVIRLVDPNTSQLARALVGHAGTVRSLRWSPDGERLASVGADRTLRVWEGATGRPLRSLALDSVPGVACWSPNGQTIAVVNEKEPAQVWQLDTGRVATSVPNAATWWKMSWSADGRGILPDGSRRVLDNLWSPDGRLCALANGLALSFRGPTGGPEPPPPIQVSGTSSIHSLAWSPVDSNILATATGGKETTVKLWDAASGRLLRTLDGNSFATVSLAWSPDGKTLVSGGDDSKRSNPCPFRQRYNCRKAPNSLSENRASNASRRASVTPVLQEWVADARRCAATKKDRPAQAGRSRRYGTRQFTE